MSEKVILVLVDGMRPDGMLGCGHPFAEALVSLSAHALDAQTVIPSVTLPCHMSLFKLELQQNVLFSDGYARECFLSMRELNDYRYNDDGKIVSDLKNLLQKQNISPLNCTIVLKGKAANNGYFKHIFNGEFNSLLNVNDSFRTRVLTQLLKDIKGADYKFATGVPQQPKVPTGLQKREVRSKIAEIKGKIRIKNYSEAKKLANILLDDLHDQGYSEGNPFRWKFNRT